MRSVELILNTRIDRGTLAELGARAACHWQSAILLLNNVEGVIRIWKTRERIVAPGMGVVAK
jgi:hypothetical protein